MQFTIKRSISDGEILYKIILLVHKIRVNEKALPQMNRGSALTY